MARGAGFSVFALALLIGGCGGASIVHGSDAPDCRHGMPRRRKEGS